MRKLICLLALFTMVYSPPIRAQSAGNLTAASTNCQATSSCLETQIPPNIGGATFKLSGTWSATVQFEGTADPLSVQSANALWVALSSTPSNSTTTATSATANGVWQVNVSAYTRVRIRVSAFTSGTVAAAINLSTAAARGGSGSGGLPPGTITGAGAATQVAIFSGASTIGGSAALTSSGGGISQTIASQATTAHTLTNTTFPGTTITETLGNFGNYMKTATYSAGVFTDFGMNFLGAGGDFGIDAVSAPNSSQLLLHGNGLIEFFSTANGFLFTGPPVNASRYDTTTNCADAAGPAACGSAPSGAVVVDAGATSVVVSTTAVTANSRIFVQFDASLGTALGITCNSTVALPTIAAGGRTAGVSFTITVPVTPITNAACYSYWIIN